MEHSAQEEKVIVWEYTMSYKDWKAENKAGEFAPFIKAAHIKTFPATLNLIKVDEQNLPQTGKSLVARFSFDAAARKVLTPEYIEALEKVGAKDIAFPLNATNGGNLAEQFGDNYHNWKGKVTFRTSSTTNPKTRKEVDVLRIVVPTK
jgi:hypothetical protein